MTDNNNDFVPTPEMVFQWHKEACRDPYNGGKFYDSKTLKYLAACAAKWGADVELEKCCEWLKVQETCSNKWFDPRHNACALAGDLRAARRPKPQTLNSIALQMLSTIERDAHYLPEITDTIRKALESIND